MRVGLSWEWIGLKVEREGEGYSSFCLKCFLTWCDILDNRIGRLHTNFEVSTTLSKKVLIFSQILSTSTFKVELKWKWIQFGEKIRTFLMKIGMQSNYIP